MPEDATKHVMMLEPACTATREEYMQMLDSWLQEHHFIGEKMKSIFDRHGRVPDQDDEDTMLFYVLQGYSDLLDERIARVGKHFNLKLVRQEERIGRHDA